MLEGGVLTLVYQKRRYRRSRLYGKGLCIVNNAIAHFTDVARVRYDTIKRISDGQFMGADYIFSLEKI
ncbi:hypothetical protein AA0473_1656 [Acetobacter orleanensis NRIC 0473]|uniref:Uncharacterized protein n=1 Tax=Acetobacter orleanensis TaxID=104099 RepID=A0A4Y3TKE6_9PROT|nr:hypothetical protein Abol_030_006 [Acetobacter orleanensis JCM 7639]GBR28154.1 hypothetical protein AA0473_1656 [Acetobacter orleanensis NRIC 0473]GEB82233.1 hypothetical protein AOR01nite_07100 [Acetobacter orleanensis]